MSTTRKFLAIAALVLAASSVAAGAAHADWVDGWGYVHGCRTFVNDYGYLFRRCF
jgi:hypothetical protein